MKVILFIAVLALSTGIEAQNRLDEQGRKTGHWKVEYPGGGTLYTAYFVEGKPVGEMIRYYENGAVRARMQFDTIRDQSYTFLYYSSGKLAAEGWHRKQQKDSVWTYYSEVSGSVRIREPYRMGALDGWVRKYYDDGQVSEEIHWVNNLKDGPWKRYYKNGALRLNSNYENGLLQGEYAVYFSDSTVQIKGIYVDEKSHGPWHYYDRKGQEQYVIQYDHGKVLDQEKYLQMMQDTINKYNAVLEEQTEME